MGIDDGEPIHYSLAEVQVCCTDRLHRTDEHGNAGIGRKEAKQRSYRVEQHSEKSGESYCWMDDPH